VAEGGASPVKLLKTQISQGQAAGLAFYPTLSDAWQA